MLHNINSKKKQKTKQILNKLDSFHSYTITKIQIFIYIYNILCRQLNTLDYVVDLLKKNKFFYNNIEYISNKKYYYKGFFYKLTNYI